MPAAFPTIPGYDIKRRVASGAMGTVYEGVQLSLGARRAIKVIHPHLADDTDFLARFELEARSAAVLDNAHIVKVIEFARQHDPPYLSMEYVDGSTLADVLKSVRPLPRDVALLVLADVADALESAHTEGVLHRDVKPSNIMFSTAGVAKLADFGLARSREASSTLSTGNQSVGTPAYMAPEQIAGGHVDPRADLFAFGIVAYELLAGERPFAGSTVPAVQTAILRDQPAALHERNPLVSRELSEFVHQLLAKDPDARPRDAAAVHQWLDRYVEQAAIAGRSQLLARFAADPDGVAHALSEKEVQSNLLRAHNLLALGEQKARDALQVLATVLQLNPRHPEALEMKAELVRILASQNVHDLRAVLTEGAARVIEASGTAAAARHPGPSPADARPVGDAADDATVIARGRETPGRDAHDEAGDDATMMRPISGATTAPESPPPPPSPPASPPPAPPPPTGDDVDATQRAVPSRTGSSPRDVSDPSPAHRSSTGPTSADDATRLGQTGSPQGPAGGAASKPPPRDDASEPPRKPEPSPPRRPSASPSPTPAAPDAGGGASGRKVVIGFLALAVLVLIGYAIVSFGFAKGTLHLTELNPPDATVVVVETDVVLSSASPFVTLKTGRYTIRATREGYATTEREVEVGRGASVDVPPLVLSREGASLTVEGSPAGALVSVDGEDVGRLPVRDANVPLDDEGSGTVEIRVSLEGYVPDTQSVRLRRGDVHTEHVELVQRDRSGLARGGRDDPDDPGSSEPGDAGDATRGDAGTATIDPRTATIDPGAATIDPGAADDARAADAGCIGRITITSGGNDLILVDGEELTRDGLALRTPQRDVELPCGTHVVSVSRGGRLGTPDIRTITIAAGHDEHLRFEF